MPTEYIHYGSSKFDKSLFNPISNIVMFTKPEGGMWASPIDSEFGWKEWCESEGYKIDKLLEHFVFSIKNGANVLFIRNKDDLTILYLKGYCIDYSQYAYHDGIHDQYYLDFEQLLFDGIDAILVYINSETYWGLYGWDCDSLLILNPDCIVE